MPLFEVVVFNEVGVVFGPKAVVAKDEKAAVLVATSGEKVDAAGAEVAVRPFK